MSEVFKSGWSWEIFNVNPANFEMAKIRAPYIEALPLMCCHNPTQVAFRNFNKKGFKILIRNRPSTRDNK